MLAAWPGSPHAVSRKTSAWCITSTAMPRITTRPTLRSGTWTRPPGPPRARSEMNYREQADAGFARVGDRDTEGFSAGKIYQGAGDVRVRHWFAAGGGRDV